MIEVFLRQAGGLVMHGTICVNVVYSADNRGGSMVAWTTSVRQDLDSGLGAEVALDKSTTLTTTRHLH
jgi:hypothetical protein